MTVTELIEKLQKYQKEIGCDGQKIGSHDIQSHVNFVVGDPDIDLDIELDRIELDLIPGCACPYGITFILKKEN